LLFRFHIFPSDSVSGSEISQGDYSALCTLHKVCQIPRPLHWGPQTGRSLAGLIRSW